MENNQNIEVADILTIGWNFALLKAFRAKDVYDRCKNVIKWQLLETEEKIILQAYELYFTTFNTDNISYKDFVPWFFQCLHGDFTPELYSAYLHLFKQVHTCDDKNIETIVNEFNKELASKEIQTICIENFDIAKIQKVCEDAATGVCVDSYEKFRANNQLDLIRKPFELVNGLHWRLPCLDACLGPLQKGDFGFMGMYVGQGKTSNIASESSFMAHQCKDDEKVIYYNNEGSEYKIQRRVWSAALGRPWGWIEENPREAEALYLEYMNGDIDRIIFYDAMSMTLADIKAISQRYNTRLIIIDQLDNVASPKGEANHDMLKIRALYQQARALSKQVAPVFTVGQLRGDGLTFSVKEQKMICRRYREMSEFNFSSVEKQSTADWIYTMGHDPSTPFVRYLNVVKNHMPSAGEQRFIQKPVKFLADISRYEDY